MANVSVTTVSQIINNKGDRFSQETKERVLKVIQDNNYKPDYFASNIITRKTKTIGMIIPDVTDFFFSKVVEGVESYLNSLGYMILLCNSKHNYDEEEKYVEELLYRSVDGIIFATPNILKKNHKLFKSTNKVPFILIDRGINKRSQGKLMVNEYVGAYNAVQYLIDKGHRHIGLLRENGKYYQISERVNAYEEALKKNNLLHCPEYTCSGDLSIEGGYKASKKILKNLKITAIFCGNDEMAIGAYKAIEESGKRIPEDISIIGFDGLEISNYLTPSLTTVFQPSFDIGLNAAKFLVSSIKNPNKKIPNIYFDTELLIRNSVDGLTN